LVSLVDLLLTVGSLVRSRGALVPGAGFGVEGTIVTLFAEDEEVLNLFLFFFGEIWCFGNIIWLQIIGG